MSATEPLKGAQALCLVRPDDAAVSVEVGDAESGEHEVVGEIELEDEAVEHPAEEARMARDPGAPTKAEIEAHEATHLPFRIWLLRNTSR